jgi:hypothetical protein
LTVAQGASKPVQAAENITLAAENQDLSRDKSGFAEI